MAKWGTCDFRQLERLRDKLEAFSKVDYNHFVESAARELAARLLAMAIKRTPVGVYPSSSGKTGGTLRRGWTAGKSGAAYARSLPIIKRGNVFEIEIINPVDYASYVEFGHRTVNGKGWVAGRFMLTISEEQLQAQAPKLIERRLMQMLKEVFNAK